MSMEHVVFPGITHLLVVYEHNWSTPHRQGGPRLGVLRGINPPVPRPCRWPWLAGLLIALGNSPPARPMGTHGAAPPPPIMISRHGHPLPPRTGDLLRWRQLLEAKDYRPSRTMPPFCARAGTGRASARCRRGPRTRSMSSSRSRIGSPSLPGASHERGRGVSSTPRHCSPRAGAAKPPHCCARPGSKTILRRTRRRVLPRPLRDRPGANHDAARLDRLLWDERIDQARRMLPRVGGDDRAVATARLKLQLSAPDVEAARRRYLPRPGATRA